MEQKFPNHHGRGRRAESAFNDFSMARSLRWIARAYLGFNYSNNGRNGRPRPCASICFDLLWCDGRDITSKAVVQRRERLEQIVTPGPGIQVGGYIEKHGIDLFQLAKEKGLEGSIAKREKSTYQPAGAPRIG